MVVEAAKNKIKPRAAHEGLVENFRSDRASRGAPRRSQGRRGKIQLRTALVAPKNGLLVRKAKKQAGLA
ncbi:hypothetical protein GCM10027048_34620 [Hymenobacter coalescens]